MPCIYTYSLRSPLTDYAPLGVSSTLCLIRPFSSLGPISPIPPREEPSHNSAPGPFPCSRESVRPRPVGDPRTPKHRLRPLPGRRRRGQRPHCPQLPGLVSSAARATGRRGLRPGAEQGRRGAPFRRGLGAPRAPPRRPRRRRAPSPALTRVEPLLVAEAPTRGSGWPRRNPGRASAQGRRSGRRRPVRRPASPPESWRPGGGSAQEKRVPGPRAPPSPGVSGAPSRPSAPTPQPHTHLPRAARTHMESRRPPTLCPARTRTLPAAGRAQTTRRGPEPLARSLPRTHARAPQPYAFAWHVLWILAITSSTSTVLFNMHFTPEAGVGQAI